ncbi:MAG: discoidin domain-containing protein, partial [Thermomicrobiales bacterium]
MIIASGRSAAGGWRRIVLLTIVLQMLVVMLPIPGFASAQAGCIAANEPNDQYAEAIELGSGEVCAEAANLTGGQDLYLWTVAAADATTRWTMSVSAIPGQLANLEIFDVVLDEAGHVTSANKLLTISGSSGQSTVSRDLMLPVGSVVTIGVATSGPGAYTLSIERGTESPPRNDTEPNDDATTATQVDGAFALSGDQSASPDEIVWTITEEDAASEWTLFYQKPVASAPSLTLRAEDGTQLGLWTPTTSGQVMIPHLGLVAGTYSLSLASTEPADGPYILETVAGEPLEAGTEAEPNDVVGLAFPIVLTGDSTLVSGQLDSRSAAEDRDVYRFTIGSDLATRQLDITVLWQEGPQRQACLIDSAERELLCREGTRGTSFDDLILAEGDYFFSVSGEAGDATTYVVRVDATREASSGYEAEPNNTIEAASLLVPEGNTFVGSGRIETSDSDFFRFTVLGEPQLWLIEVTGPGVASVELRDVVGTALATGSASDGVATLYDMFLLPGDQQIEIRGDSELYSVRLTPMGPPDPLAELEPNSSLDTSQALALFEQRTGRLPTIEDADNYRFALQNDGYVRVSLAVPADGIVSASLSWQGREVVALATSEPGAPLFYEAWLRAGDYQLRLTSSAPSFDPYALEVLAIDPFDLPQDLEPNDTEFHTVEASYGMPVTGAGASIMRSGDTDWFALPVLESESDAVLTAVDEFTTRLYQRDPLSGVAIPIEVVTGTEAGSYLATLPAGVEILMRVTIVGEYAVSLDLVGTEADPGPVIVIPTLDPQVTVSVDAGDATVAAYWEDGQTLDGTVSLTNSGSEPLDLTLDSWIGDMRWSVTFAEPVTVVAAGETVTVPVQVAVAPDAWAERPIMLVVRATSERGWATGESTITVGRSAPPVNPAVADPLPESMLGGVNVAWTSLGAVPDPVAGAESGFDGRFVSGFGVRATLDTLPHEITVDLAGDVPIPLAGFVIDPRGYDGMVLNQLRDFEVEVSMDGVSFETVLSASMSGGQWEHGFALGDTVEATHVRLRMLTAQELEADSASFGEFKVVAQPGWSRPGTEAGVNLADPTIGGHVVVVQPPHSSNATFNGMLLEDGAADQVSLEPDTRMSVTVGFHQDRAALIDRLTWQNLPELLPDQIFDIATIEVAVDSTTGPWVSVGGVRRAAIPKAHQATQRERPFCRFARRRCRQQWPLLNRYRRR